MHQSYSPRKAAQKRLSNGELCIHYFFLFSIRLEINAAGVMWRLHLSERVSRLDSSTLLWLWKDKAMKLDPGITVVYVFLKLWSWADGNVFIGYIKCCWEKAVSTINVARTSYVFEYYPAINICWSCNDLPCHGDHEGAHSIVSNLLVHLLALGNDYRSGSFHVDTTINLRSNLLLSLRAGQWEVSHH